MNHMITDTERYAVARRVATGSKQDFLKSKTDDIAKANIDVLLWDRYESRNSYRYANNHIIPVAPHRCSHSFPLIPLATEVVQEFKT